MKKILIVNNNLHIGGVQKALVNLLWNIRGEYNITLLLFYKGGELLEDLPQEVNVISANGAWRYLGMTKDDVHTLPDKLCRGVFAAISRLMGRRYAIRLMSLGQKKLRDYDVAVSYLHNSSDRAFYGGCNDFVLDHVRAQKKVAFLHCDYIRCGADTSRNGEQYARFDTIAACSQGCAAAFLQAHPELKGKVKVVKNCHRFEKIQEEAQADPRELTFGKVNVVTVARLGKEKGVERALRAIEQLGASKERIHYYVIGDGIQRPLLEAIVQEQNLDGIVTLCGQLQNPYGYIRAADLLLIPSYSEAAPLVIGEAASLGTPILSTDTSSAREMIEDTGYGWVCANSEEAMTNALQTLCDNWNQWRTEQQMLRKENCQNEDALSDFRDCMS